MKLFTNGCSFTYGAGILTNHFNMDEGLALHDSNPDYIKNKILREQHTWTYQLHQKLNTTEYVIRAMGAGSNQRIVRTTFDFFIDRIEKNLPVDDYLAVIQWTDITRYELYDDYHKQYLLILHQNVLPEVDSTRKEYLLQKCLEHPKNFKDAFYKDCICLSNFFTLHNIKYVFCTMNTILYPSLYLNEKLKWLDGSLEQSSLQSQLPINLVYPDLHPNVLGHAAIAERLHKYLQKIYSF